MNINAKFYIMEEEVCAKVMEGEAIIINLSNGIYYSLDGVGGTVWQMIELGYSIEEMIQTISVHHKISSEQVKLDLEKLVEEMIQENLIKVSNDQHPKKETQILEIQQNGSYESPKLNIYRDMGDLLALDPPMPALAQTPWTKPDDKSSPNVAAK